ncbi:MAG TPA: ATP-binding protein [Candidatus Eisenbacteria bacterium]|nr:ATP-binding protein [Candidatus Eisenbacteria bacterium]
MNADPLRLSASRLSPSVDASRFAFSDTSRIEPLTGVVGQERALEALDFGLRMKGPGFNLYVAGPVGTGKSSLVHRMVMQLAQDGSAPPDWCYVNNFQDPSRPLALSFPAGQGRVFQRESAAFIESLRLDIPAAFESKKYLDAKSKLGEETEAKRKALFRELTELGLAQGYGFEETPGGFGLVPLKAGRPMTEEELEEATDAERHDLTERRKKLEAEMREFQVRLHGLAKDAGRQLRELDAKLVTNAIEGRYESLRRTYAAMEAVAAYLQRVHDDVIENYRDFLPREGPVLPFPGFEARRPDMTRYEVNLVVERDPAAGVPVVDEPHPTYTNLVGKIERRAHLGVMYTDFTEIRAGALLQANGGYLIVNALDVLRQPFSWDALKRTIKTGTVTIEEPSDFYGFSTAGLRPIPIPIEVKVVLLGPTAVYHLLQSFEEDFAKLFKVKADFDTDVVRSEREDQQYAQFVSKLCREEDLPHFDAEAVAELIRQGHRLAERRDRLSLRFSLLSDLIREAGFWARREGRTIATRADVEGAVARKRHRSNLAEQWIQDEIRDGTLMVDLEGEVVGQVNGLSVHVLGDYSFGRPSRITARTYVGAKGIIDIQREAELAGDIHSKGVMTLAGYLAGKFAGTHPFAVSASLTFEQTYSEIEGDSAAVAELAAILSSLAELPIRQGLAVTGSVNQVGEVQPIGGVNEKIEGFYESCSRSGLNGKQGVIIPARNVKHLALRRDVVEAVEAGRFSVYAVSRVEEAVQLLTGVPAGERDAEGAYPAESVFGRAGRRLEEMAEAMAEWGEGDEKEEAPVIEKP